MFFVSLKILFTSGRIISYFGALGAVKIQNGRLRPGASFRTAGRTNENPREAQTSHSRQFPLPSATASGGTRPAVYIQAKRRPPHSSMTSTFCRLKNPRRAAIPSIVRSTASSTDRSSPRTRPSLSRTKDGRQGSEQQFDRDAAHAPSPSGPQHSALDRRRLTSASVLSACSIIPLRSSSGMSSRTPSVPDATPSSEAE